MKRIQEKVRDIVDVRRFENLKDFAADPAATLAAYHFTDGTSELMAKWLSLVSGGPDGEGTALALAGYRGVGKSHFLAAFGAIAGYPDLRNKISDSYVSAAAQSLSRKRYPIAFVRRGSRPTLLEEFQVALGNVLDVPPESLGSDVGTILTAARDRFRDLPLLILIDTAIERSERVTRDDGALLGEIAKHSRANHFFVGVALDDDIAGADGSNSAIVQTFSIDFLDQEHLYKVVDTHVFPKNQQLRPVLHNVYEYFRAVIPSFRWSEQKFSTLYPLHPAILEVSPFVRLYVHDFALLGFAAEAGERILGRPANSLIALDEVFDSSEKELRKIDDLQEAFAAYDQLNTEVVAKIPVMQRLQAKLILKALLLLSLEGQGTTAADICSGMLIFDENDPQKALRTVEELIRMFAAALPDAVVVSDDDGREVRYGLKVSSKDSLNRSLDLAALEVDPEVITDVLHRQFHERFSDSTFLSLDGTRKWAMECNLVWRGGVRRGRVTWHDGKKRDTPTTREENEHHDWEVSVDLTRSTTAVPGERTDSPKVIWVPDELTKSESDTLLRYHVLTNVQSVRETYGDALRGPLHSHTVALDRIFTRAFLDDGKLTIDGFDYNLTDEARTSSTLSQTFSVMLEPLFEARYPQHPYFLEKLGVGEVSSLVADLYSGSRQQLTEVQQLAQTYALPLGLVRLTDGAYVPAGEEMLRSNEHVRTVLKLVDEGGIEGAPLQKIYGELKRSPFGLVHEAQQLILAAMVSQRMIEFVTSKDDRINQRSLDLKIIWDDIVGVALPAEVAYSNQKLQKWAAVFAKDREFRSFDSESDRKALIDGLGDWFENWESAGILRQFNAVPAEYLSTKLWRVGSKVTNTLGAAVQSIAKMREGVGTLEECIGRISEIFLDDLDNLEKAAVNLSTLEIFVKNFQMCRKVRTYISLAEPTDSGSLETLRSELFEKLAEFENIPNEACGREIGYLWAKFEREFIEHFTLKHDSVMRSHSYQEQAAEALASNDWWMFENFIPLVEIPEQSLAEVRSLRRRLHEAECKADTPELLRKQPFCSCGFTLMGMSEWESLVEDFREVVSQACSGIRDELTKRSKEIVPHIKEFTTNESKSLSAAAASLLNEFKKNTVPECLSEEQRQILLVSLKLADLSSDMGGRQSREDEGDLPISPAAIPETVLSVN